MENPKKPTIKIDRKKLTKKVMRLLERGVEDSGICTQCGKITEGDTEPDVNYGKCDYCGEYGLFGLEDALLRYGY
jgi:DNA-directed RNA polymerase subunit RPC12/RpoP